MTPGIFILVFLALFVVFLVIKGVRIVQQSEAMVIERFGKYRDTLTAGLNIIIPVFDKPREIISRVSRDLPDGNRYVQFIKKERIDLRETVFDFPKQNVITKDNVTTEINALLYFQVMDPVKATYEIENLPMAIEKLTQTTLRNVIGELDLDECLTGRDTAFTNVAEQLNCSLRTSCHPASQAGQVVFIAGVVSIPVAVEEAARESATTVARIPVVRESEEERTTRDCSLSGRWIPIRWQAKTEQSAT